MHHHQYMMPHHQVLLSYKNPYCKLILIAYSEIPQPYPPVQPYPTVGQQPYPPAGQPPVQAYAVPTIAPQQPYAPQPGGNQVCILSRHLY